MSRQTIAVGVMENPKKKVVVGVMENRKKKEVMEKKVIQLEISEEQAIRDLTFTEEQLTKVGQSLLEELKWAEEDGCTELPARKKANAYLQVLKEIAIEEEEPQVPIYEALLQIKDNHLFAVWFNRVATLL